MSAVAWGVVQDAITYMRPGVFFSSMHACSVAAAMRTGLIRIEHDVSQIPSRSGLTRTDQQSQGLARS